MIEYRGFLIEVKSSRTLGWTVRWEEITGPAIRHSNGRDSQDDAISYAKQRIDEYHSQIDKSTYR